MIILKYFEKKRYIRKNIKEYEHFEKFEKRLKKLYNAIYKFVLGDIKKEQLQKEISKTRNAYFKLCKRKKKQESWKKPVEILIDYDYCFDYYLKISKQAKSLNGKRSEEDFTLLEQIMEDRKEFLLHQVVYFETMQKIIFPKKKK